ncbi:hypothetical protein HPB47_020584 [Ixodes persulcatus]|uniref:Uncharacterized protein n=1 Tax=Ixodes persulcatus TaxID=34615 RepID=A0AC60QH67_IXOPE|nr:hypothetical protein HPB47_020584 [Ixodes persulcatus]
MKLTLVITVSICLCLPCHGDPPKPSSDDFTPSSPLSMLRKAIFGTRAAEELFISRVASATQRLAAIVSNPAVTRALRRYYVSLLRSPDFKGLVKSIDAGVPGGKKSNATLTSSQKTSASKSTPVSTRPTPTTSTPATKMTTDVKTTTSQTEYKYYFDPELVTLPGRSIAESTVARRVTSRNHVEDRGPLGFKHHEKFHRSRRTIHVRHVGRYIDAIRWDDVDSCVSFLVCEMSRVPWRYGPFGVKVERFFRYPVWDYGSSASHYASMARHGRRLGGCRGRITSCRRPLGPMVQEGNSVVHRRGGF